MVHVIIEGTVQGVGFRQYVKYQAKKLSVKGWVRNIPEGRVEAVFAGNSSDVEKMVEICRKGPFMAEIKNLEKEELPDQDFEDFQIIRD